MKKGDKQLLETNYYYNYACIYFNFFISNVKIITAQKLNRY